MNSKYFVVNDIKVASVMGTLLGKDYYKFTNDEGKEVYTFIRSKNIGKIYGHALTIIQNL